MGNDSSKPKGSAVIVDTSSNADLFAEQLRTNLQRLILYASGSDVSLQREVAESLANTAVRADRQVLLTNCGAIQLLLPLSHSPDPEVQRLSCHCLANLSVDLSNQLRLAQDGAVSILVRLLRSPHDAVVRQAAKALANIGVHPDNKLLVGATALEPLLALVQSARPDSVKLEAIACIANLAVADANEIAIAGMGGISAIVKACQTTTEAELQCQCARALRNLSVNSANKRLLREADGEALLHGLSKSPVDRVRLQALKALENLQGDMTSTPASPATADGTASAASE